MSNKTKETNLTLKRFVIRKNLIGKNVIITFVNTDGKTMRYSHDAVYTANQERFEGMKCFAKYKTYTQTHTMPAFCRDLNLENSEVKAS
jgi:hypothetical protein